jgi:hypothetical protein
MAWLLSAMAALVVLAAPARGADLLADAGGGLYEIRITTFSDGDLPLFETRGRLRIDALDEGQWRVRLLSAEVFDRLIGRWDSVIVDSVDPRALDLPDGVLVEFVVDGEPDLTTLIPEDIPNIAFGLLLETTTLLAICSEEGGLDRLEAPGDSAQIDGFTMFWTRPHGSPANRRVLRPGRVTFEGVENGVATVSVRPEGLLWTTVRGYGDYRLSLGEGDFPITIRVDAATGALQRVAVERSMLTFREFGEVPDATLPDRDAVDFPADAPSFTTRRAVELERISESD